MESHLVQQQKGLLVKIPDISNALQALHHLMKKDDTVSCHFELADSVFANAKIKKEDTVLLWLGANVMLEYSYEEADQLLTKNLKVREERRKQRRGAEHAISPPPPSASSSSRRFFFCIRVPSSPRCVC